MKKTNVAKLRNEISALLDYVEKGKEVEIQRRNISVAKLVPVKRPVENRTQLGSGEGSVKFLGEVLTPALKDDDWEMHQ